MINVPKCILSAKKPPDIPKEATLASHIFFRNIGLAFLIWDGVFKIKKYIVNKSPINVVNNRSAIDEADVNSNGLSKLRIRKMIINEPGMITNFGNCPITTLLRP
jgi:hypothetical protein